MIFIVSEIFISILIFNFITFLIILTFIGRMPLGKRILYSPMAYANPQIFEDSTPDEIFLDINVAGMTGALSQIGSEMKLRGV